MTKISSPYNFVPLNKYVYIPEWWDKVSNDIPFSDGEDGSIEFTFTNVSPIFTRNGSASKDERYSAHVAMPDGKRLYFLPGSSIKGMLRSSLEVMSFGKMIQYDDRSFGYRTFNENENDYETYHSTITNQKCGWLQKEGESYSLIPCNGDFKTVNISELFRKYGYAMNKNGIGDRNKAIAGKGNDLYPIYKKDGKNYKLVCTGKMNGKKHEYLFPLATSGKVPLMETTEDGKIEKKKVLKQFLSIYAQNKDATDFINDYLEKGKRIHVFYVMDTQGDLIAMGLSKMMKLPYGNSISDLVKKGQEAKTERDLCETMFGYIRNSDKEHSLKGRIQICNAYCVDSEGKELTISDGDLFKVSGILGEPKPSFYPFYLNQDEKNGEHRTYADADTIAGRKFYRIHEGSSVTQLPPGKPNMMVYFNAIRQNKIFKCHINVHNLKAIEVGALLYSIIQEDGVYHNLGLAKSFGYGKLKCCKKEDIKLTGLTKSVDDFIQCFKDEIHRWGQKVLNNSTWNLDESTEVATLKAIRKDHTNAEVRMLEMKRPTGRKKDNGKDDFENEYDNIKDKKNFQILKEKGITSSAIKSSPVRASNSQPNFDVVKATVMRPFNDGAMISLDGSTSYYLPVKGLTLRPGQKIYVRRINKTGSPTFEFYKKE